MLRSSVLTHAAGWVKKNHKYIARVPNENRKGYRYFYTVKEYEAYLKSIDDPDLVDVTDIVEKAKELENEYNSDKTDYAKQKKLEDEIDEINDKLYFRDEDAYEVIDKHGDEQVSERKKNLKDENDSRKGTLADSLAKKSMTEITVKDDETQDPIKAEREHKYVAKIKINDKWRYFYDEDEYRTYMERKSYIQNEPEFMQDIPKLKEPETAEEAAANVNPHYKFSYDKYMDKDNASKLGERNQGVQKDGKYYIDQKASNEAGDRNAFTMNCFRCTQTYELRRRGYDVEATAQKNASKNGSQYTDDLSKIYKNPKINHYKAKDLKSGTDLENAIKSQGSKSSRGCLDVYWTLGGGHSVAYEIDKKGKVKILDTQTGKSYTANQFYKLGIREAQVCRTDNLALREDVLKYAKPSNH